MFQFLALATTLGISIISGLFTGHLLNTKCCRNKKTYFDDKDNWDLEEEVVMIGA